MGGLGATELLIILFVIVLLFGPTIVAFFAGYALGQRRGSAKTSAPETPATPASDTPGALPADGADDGSTNV